MGSHCDQRPRSYRELDGGCPQSIPVADSNLTVTYIIMMITGMVCVHVGTCAHMCVVHTCEQFMSDTYSSVHMTILSNNYIIPIN